MTHRWRGPVGLVVAMLAALAAPALAPAEAAQSAEHVSVIVTLVVQADVKGVAAEQPRARRRAVIDLLRSTADETQRPLRSLLARRQRQGRVTAVEPLWVTNAIVVSAEPAVVAELAARPEVASVEPNRTFEAPESQGTGPATPNVDLVGADDLWALGYRGAGVVVATMDTGVWGTHPDLAAQYRGGTNSWYDPYGQHTTPWDQSGHGTMTTGIIVGRDGSGEAVGVAPQASWMAAKIFNDQGQATLAAVHQAFQWLLDPDGNPATDDAPAVVNGSWTFSSPGCELEFLPDVQALRASGIVPVFAAGNFGPGEATAASPGNYPEALAIGATDITDAIWYGSSRGSATCAGSTGVHPDLVAPGVDILTTDLSDLYAFGTGTSMATPHVTGALALLRQAFPSRTPTELEAALVSSARDLGPAGPDDTYGAGRLDIVAAYQTLAGASIGDLVFDDTDGNGVRDDGEPGIDGVVLTLTGAGPDGTLGTGDDVAVGARTSDSFGAYVFDGLAAGIYRVDVDPATLPAGATLTTGNVPFDTPIADGQAVRDADFGYQPAPPPPGTSIAGFVFHDRDGDGAYETGDPGLGGVNVTIAGPGPDGVLGGPDDVVVGVAVTAADGTYIVGGLAPGPHRVAADAATGPPGTVVTTVPAMHDFTLAAGEVRSAVDFGVGPRGRGLLLSLEAALSRDGVVYAPEDVAVVDGLGWAALIDGSDVGWGGLNLDALHVLDADSFVVSFATRVNLAGLGVVEDTDLLRFDATALGTTTAGALSLWFDGSDVGLTTNAEDVDAVAVLADGRVVVSALGAVSVPGVTGADEDLLIFTPTALGPTTAGQWAMWFDGSDVGLNAASENVDGVDVLPDGTVRLSTAGAFAVPDGTPVVSGGDESVFACAPLLLGSTTQSAWQAQLVFDGPAAGLPAASDLDAVAVR